MTNWPIERDHGRVRDRSDRRHAYSVTAIAALVALAVAGSVVAAAVDSGQHAEYVNEIVAAVVTAITAVIGAVVALAQPRNVIGWLILGGAALAGTAEALTELGVHGVRTNPGSVPAAVYLVTFGVIARAIASVLFIAAVPAYFPDGRLPGPRWSWVRWSLIVAVVATIAGGLIAPIETRLGQHWHGPFTPGGELGDNLQGIDVLGVVFTVVAGAGAIAGLVSRWRRRGPVVRQQLLLFACAVAVSVLFLIGVLITVSVSSSGGPSRAIFGLAGLPLPIAVAIATLNHGLYDLRRAANRTILWLLMTSSIAAIYVVVVVSAAALSPDRRAWWPPAIAATVAAVALFPLRNRLHLLVHRVVYGRWREPYAVLSGLAARLEAAADVDLLLDAAVKELGTELDLRDISVRDRDGTVLAGAAEPADESVPLQAYGVTVGELTYRRPDRQLSESEILLIRDLARHLGGTLHARALFNDLQRTRERLVLAREEERRRLRRDLHDGIGPALAGLTLKAETARALLPAGADGSADQLQDLSDEIRATVVDVRRVVEGLRPPALDELGLDGACRQAVDRLTRAAGVTADVQTNTDLSRLPAAVEVAAFRIILEAVTNVVRHARAQRCCVSLTRSSTALVVTIADDGAGLVEGSRDAGNGLATMRERADELGGSLSVVRTSPGFRVEALLPTRPIPAGTVEP
jgi:signal transduction histidine kinase